MNKNPDPVIWKARDLIDALEAAQETVIDRLPVPDITGNLADKIREVRLHMVSAWELLKALSRGDAKRIVAAREYLRLGQSRMEEAWSELGILGLGGEAADAWRERAVRCQERLLALLKELEPQGNKSPEARVVIEDDGGRILCSVCGETAATFRKTKVKKNYEADSPMIKAVIYRGPLNPIEIPIDDADAIIGLLEKEDLASLHDFVQQYILMEEGLDCYCPDCDRAFCSVHYDTWAVWDEGFYDCTYGECPDGHRRVLDD